VIENIARFLEAGDSPYYAAMKGSAQIGFTIISLTVSLLAVLIPLGVAALGIHVGDASVNSLSRSGPPRQGVRLLERAGIPTGVLTPIEVYVPPGGSPGRVVAAVSRIPGVRTAVAPGGPSWRRHDRALVAVLPVTDGPSSAGQATVAAVRDGLTRAAPAVLVGGYGASLVDQVHSLYGSFPYVLAGLAIITFILLARAFRSLLLPAKAIVLNLLSVGAVYGVLVLVWQDGRGSGAIWGLPATGAITAWIPLFVFAFLYGLSMDYEVFIISRMREEYDRTGSTDEAVITGIGRTGRLVTSAALILFLAMAALASAPFTFLKIFATGVGAGILLDATVVRSLLVPALVSLFGRWNWWLPAWAARMLRVGAGLREEPRAEQFPAGARHPAAHRGGEIGAILVFQGVHQRTRDVVIAHRGPGARVGRRIGDRFHRQQAGAGIVGEGDAEPRAVGRLDER